MQVTGIVRRIDALGRLVLPAEWRRQLQMDIDTPVEILAEGQHLIVRRYSPGCILCGERQVLGATRLCTRCREELLGAGTGHNLAGPTGR